MRVDLYPHKLAVQKEERLAPLYYAAFVEMCLALRGEFSEAVKEQEGVEWLDAPKREGNAKCPICGAGLREGRVLCLKCKTVHHRECWEWNGGCSMFACGEQRCESS